MLQNKSNSNEFMNDLYLQHQKGSRKWKKWAEKVNVLCIVNQDYQRYAIAVEHSSKSANI